MAYDRDKIEEFWKNKEESYGEKLLHRSIAQTLSRKEPSYIGLLFLMDQHLYFEYTTGARKSILDTLVNKFKEEKKKEQRVLAIPNDEIVDTGIISIRAAKFFMKKWEKTTEELKEYIEAKKSTLLDRIIFGTALCILTRDRYYIFQTPEDKQWAEILKKYLAKP